MKRDRGCTEFYYGVFTILYAIVVVCDWFKTGATINNVANCEVLSFDVLTCNFVFVVFYGTSWDRNPIFKSSLDWR